MVPFVAPSRPGVDESSRRTLILLGTPHARPKAAFSARIRAVSAKALAMLNTIAVSHAE